MLVNNSFRFTDLSNIGDRVIDIGIGVLISEAIHQIRKYKLLSRKYNFRKKYGWFKIGCNVICFIFVAYLDLLFTKIHAKFLGKACDRVMMYNFKTGFKIFNKIEPDIALKLFKAIEKVVNDLKISKITGVSSYS